VFSDSTYGDSGNSNDAFPFYSVTASRHSRRVICDIPTVLRAQPTTNDDDDDAFEAPTSFVDYI